MSLRSSAEIEQLTKLCYENPLGSLTASKDSKNDDKILDDANSNDGDDDGLNSDEWTAFAKQDKYPTVLEWKSVGGVVKLSNFTHPPEKRSKIHKLPKTTKHIFAMDTDVKSMVYIDNIVWITTKKSAYLIYGNYKFPVDRSAKYCNANKIFYWYLAPTFYEIYLDDIKAGNFNKRETLVDKSNAFGIFLTKISDRKVYVFSYYSAPMDSKSGLRTKRNRFGIKGPVYTYIIKSDINAHHKVKVGEYYKLLNGIYITKSEKVVEMTNASNGYIYMLLASPKPINIYYLESPKIVNSIRGNLYITYKYIMWNGNLYVTV
jgi:hypothetical protein